MKQCTQQMRSQAHSSVATHVLPAGGMHARAMVLASSTADASPGNGCWRQRHSLPTYVGRM